MYIYMIFHLIEKDGISEKNWNYKKKCMFLQKLSIKSYNKR